MLPANRIRNLPHFEIDELIGRFDLDDEGNFIILSRAVAFGRTELIDLDGRLVNERGYLIDDDGNVITRAPERVIFEADELEDDGEIPAPFCYMKNKENVGLAMNMFAME